MEKELNNLDRLKGKNPFTVPNGYMEDLTANIMSQLPDKPRVEEAKKISMMDRVRPWLYMAAVFAGLGLFFKGIVSLEGEKSQSDTLLVQSKDVSDTKAAMLEEEDEYLEYLEAQYTDYLLAEELGNYE